MTSFETPEKAAITRGEIKLIKSQYQQHPLQSGVFQLTVIGDITETTKGISRYNLDEWEKTGLPVAIIIDQIRYISFDKLKKLVEFLGEKDGKVGFCEYLGIPEGEGQSFTSSVVNSEITYFENGITYDGSVNQIDMQERKDIVRKFLTNFARENNEPLSEETMQALIEEIFG